MYIIPYGWQCYNCLYIAQYLFIIRWRVLQKRSPEAYSGRWWALVKNGKHWDAPEQNPDTRQSFTYIKMTLVNHSHTSRWHLSVIHIHQDWHSSVIHIHEDNTRQWFTYIWHSSAIHIHQDDTRQSFTYVKIT